jgi:hypothetical protein
MMVGVRSNSIRVRLYCTVHTNTRPTADVRCSLCDLYRGQRPRHVLRTAAYQLPTTIAPTQPAANTVMDPPERQMSRLYAAPSLHVTTCLSLSSRDLDCPLSSDRATFPGCRRLDVSKRQSTTVHHQSTSLDNVQPAIESTTDSQ